MQPYPPANKQQTDAIRNPVKVTVRWKRSPDPEERGSRNRCAKGDTKMGHDQKESRGYHAKTIGTTGSCVLPHAFAVASMDSGWYPRAWFNKGSRAWCKKQEVHQKTADNPPNPRRHNSVLPLFEKPGTFTPNSPQSVGATRFSQRSRPPARNVKGRLSWPSPFRGRYDWARSGRSTGAQTA